MNNHPNRGLGRPLVVNPESLSPRDVVVTCMAKVVLAGVSLSDWDVGDARKVVDACMTEVKDTCLIAELWRSTALGYFVNIRLDEALARGLEQIKDLTEEQRARLILDGSTAVNEDDIGLHRLHVKALNLIGASDLLPLAERVLATNKAICETL